MAYLMRCVLAAVLLCPFSAQGQILAIPRLDRLVEADGEGFSEEEVKSLDIIQARIAAGQAFVVDNEEEGMLFWNHQPTELLVGSRFSFAEEEATLHSELAAVLSGAWRFSVGTTLSVDAAADEPAEGGEAGTDADETDAADPERAFKTFLAGGGNLSLQAVRPLIARAGGYNAQFLFFTPRAWVNVPAIGVSENVDNGGAEVGAEYQYQRLRTDDRQPFLVLQVRGGLAFGTSQFHESIGRTEHSPFAYVAPALNFVVQNRVKIGVLGFFGPDSFDEMPRFRVNFEVLGSNQGGEGEEDDS